MNNEEFYGVLKLVSGEELFAKISPCEEEYRTILILESPVTFETIPMKKKTGKMKDPPLLVCYDKGACEV